MSFTHRYLLLTVASVLGSGIAAGVGAQESRADTTGLAPLVITATRLPTPASAVTATVTVLDGGALRSEGVTHLGEALRRVPGIALTRSSSLGSQTALFMRGGQSNYVRVLVDGVPLNEPGGVVDLGRVTLADVERIEIVRGPASVLYGSEAVAGVIQILTRRGRGPASVRTELGASSYGGERAALGASGHARQVAWTLSADHHASDGILPFNNAYRNQGGVASLAFGESTRNDLRFTARYNTSVYRYPTASDGSVTDRNAERTEHRLVLGIDAGRRWTDRLETRVQLSAMDLLPRTNDGADDGADTLGFYGYFARGTVTRRLADLRSTLRVGATQHVTVGAEFSRDTERSRSVSLSEYGDFPDSFRAARENSALYAQGQGSLREVAYTLGARLDDNSAFGTFRTLRAGLAWSPHARVRLRASAGSAFKAPSFFENFATGFTLGSAVLSPERALSADAGIDVTMPRGSILRATLFTQRFRDLIQYDGAPSPGEPNYYNVAAANAGGVEFEAVLPAVGGATATIGHTWTDTRVVDAGFDTTPEANFVEGARLLRRPAHVTTLHIVRTYGASHTVTLGMTRIGDRHDRAFSTYPPTIVILPAYVTIDAALELRIPSRFVRDARLQLRADNLADVRTQQIAGFASPGRVWHAGLKLER